MDENRQTLGPAPSPGANGDTVSAEDVRVGYQVAAQLAIYDGQLSWQVTGIFLQFGILMIAGAIFPSFIGPENHLVLSIAGMLVSLAGLLMTIMFASMVSRVRTYEEYWVLRAMHLEMLLPSVITTFQGSDRLSRERLYTVGRTTVRLPKYSVVKSKVMLGSLFLCFLLAFLGLLATDLFRLCSALR